MSPWLRLVRPRVCLLALAGTFAGCVLERPVLDGRLGLALVGAGLLAGGCAALNQVQEREEDSRMDRTRDRPLPAGRISPAQALGFSAALLALSGVCLRAGGGGTALALAGLALLLYNGLYTPLKKRTSFAMLLGGLAGAMPPVLGFAAAGGDPLAPRILLPAVVLYVWQVPHFWLFAQLHAADYRAAGFCVPQLGQARPRPPLPFVAWMIAYSAGLLLLPALGLVAAPQARWFLVFLAVAVAAACPLILARKRLGFALVNVSLLLYFLGLSADALWLGA